MLHTGKCEEGKYLKSIYLPICEEHHRFDHDEFWDRIIWPK